MNAVRTIFRNRYLRTVLSKIVERERRGRLMGEDFVPYEIHRFDTANWVIKETTLGVRLWCSLDDRAISRPILLNAYEVAESAFLRTVVRPGDLVVDGGANIGYFTLQLAKLVGPSGSVEAFEPLDYLAEALAASVAENGFESRIRVHRAALDREPGTLNLRHAPRTANFGGAHLAPGTTLTAGHRDDTVNAVRLDDIVAGRACAFIKLDVEGAEPRAIEGAVATLNAHAPTMLAELHERQLRAVSGIGATDFIERMAALNYRCSRLEPDGSRGRPLTRYADDQPLNAIFDRVPAATGTQ